MPLGLHMLHSHDLSASGADVEQANICVDIVAVHGLGEDSKGAWTHHATGTLWLRDLLPRSIHNARVLTFDYDSRPSFYTGIDFMDKVQSHATTLVADLEGERNLGNASRRPVIFICHGLGGIIVKSALVHSASRTSRFTSHLNSIYVSTFAIMFFGTPHDHIDVGKWLPSDSSLSIAYQTDGDRHVAEGGTGLPITVHTLEVITNQFAPLMKKVHMFLFWEGLKTELPSGSDYMVHPSSAAPHLYDTERCGIPNSNHSGMIKFQQSDSAYRTIISALIKYCNSAPAIITYRWKEAIESLMRMRRTEASELTGLPIDVPDKIPLSTKSKNGPIDVAFNEHFHPPGIVSMDFIGHEDIMKTLQNAFNPEEQSLSPKQQKRFVIHGIGGTGKTQISAKYAQENRQNYWAIFTIDASSPETAKQSFCKIGRMGGLEATEDSGKHFLSQSQKTWLLIIDNADKEDIIFESLVVPGERGHILVTSRNPDLRRQGNVGAVEVKGLKKQEAFKLLMKVADILPPWDLSTETAANQITKTLGYLALPVFQVGNIIYNKICNLQEFMGFWQRFRQNRQRRANANASDDDTARTNDIYSIFDAHFNNVMSSKAVPSQDAVEILNIISFFHFDHIRVDIFERAMALEQNKFRQCQATSLKARLMNALITRFRPPRVLPRILRQSADDMHPLCIKEALRKLYTLSLISYGPNERSFSLHPLAHSWARDRIFWKERGLWAIISFYTLMASIPVPPWEAGDSDSSFRRSLLPHLNECLEACPTDFKGFYGLEIGKYRRLLLPFQPSLVFSLQEMIQNAAKCGILYAETGDFAKSVYYLSVAKEALVNLVGPNDAKTTATMLGLASILWGLGRLKEAISLQEQVVKSRQVGLGPAHRDTLLAMDSLGQSFWLNGQYCEALQLQQQTAENMQIHLGEDDNDTLKALDHLGVTLGSWHRYRESRDIHQKVLEIRMRTLKEDDLGVLETKNNLAMALLDLKEFATARSLMEEVYIGRKVQMGKEHPYTLWALCYLAKIYTEEGNPKKAEHILVEGIAAGKRSLGEQHLGVLVGCGELARAYSRQGRLDEAVSLTLETVEKVKRFRGHEHPDYATGMRSLGIIWERKKDNAKAINAYRIALEATEKRLTSDHPLYKIISDRIIFLNNKAQCNEYTEPTVADASATYDREELRIRRLPSTQTW
ncbi:hypothetical protein N7486_006490 [Penicillium sp. IBT 16267x]|nr:hypothetical protein N7486_006490 [Penicillium sp. IBT 16267x]